MDATAVALRSTWEFSAIGTRWRIDTATPLKAEVARRIETLIERFDRAWSRFRDDSLVTDLSPHGGSRTAPADTRAMLDLYVDLDDATQGAINPLIGDVLARRGYDAAYSLVDRGAQPAPAGWQAILSWSGEELTLREPALLDVGAVGKGRLVDLVAGELSAASVERFVVDASGDLRVGSAPSDAPERVALEHPFRPGRAIGVWEVADGALCASATGRRAWTGLDGSGLHHVLDARTGEPVRTVAATWAAAPEAMVADGIASALFFDGGTRLAARLGVAWVRMLTDGRVEWSPGAPAEVFA